MVIKYVHHREAVKSATIPDDGNKQSSRSEATQRSISKPLDLMRGTYKIVIDTMMTIDQKTASFQ